MLELSFRDNFLFFSEPQRHRFQVETCWIAFQKNRVEKESKTYNFRMDGQTQTQLDEGVSQRKEKKSFDDT